LQIKITTKEEESKMVEERKVCAGCKSSVECTFKAKNRKNNI